MSAHSLALTATGIINALTPPARVDVGRSLSDFAGIKLATFEAIGRCGSAFQTAAYGRGFAAQLSPADIAVLADFVDFLRGDVALLPLRAEPEPADKQYSHDGYSHHMDQEKL